MKGVATVPALDNTLREAVDSLLQAPKGSRLDNKDFGTPVSALLSTELTAQQQGELEKCVEYAKLMRSLFRLENRINYEDGLSTETVDFVNFNFSTELHPMVLEIFQNRFASEGFKSELIRYGGFKIVVDIR